MRSRFAVRRRRRELGQRGTDRRRRRSRSRPAGRPGRRRCGDPRPGAPDPGPGRFQGARCGPARTAGRARSARSALAWSICAVEAEEIDRLNILAATLAGMSRALRGLQLRPALALIDGNRLPSRPALSGSRDRPWRCQRTGHQRRLDPGQDRARSPHGRTRPTLSRLRIRAPQGLSDRGSCPRARASSGPAPNIDAVLRRCAPVSVRTGSRGDHRAVSTA